jgi:gas vesicle protein
MKFNETILGSIIIGTLIGGAILISSAMSKEDKPGIKFMSVADGDKHEQVLHKEVVIDMNNNSEIEWNEDSLSNEKIEAGELASKVEKAISEVLGEFPEEVDIKIQIKKDNK